MPTSALILLTVTCFFVKADSDENIYSDNGWRPMSNEKVFALQRNFIKTPIQIRNLPGNSVDNVFQRNAIKIVKPSVVHLNKESIKEQEAIFSLRKEIERNERAFEGSTKSPTTNMTQKTYYEESKLARKAKNIAESDVILITENVSSNPIQHNAEERNKTKKRKISSLRNGTYDVHESLEQDNIITNENNFKSSVSNGYRYERPKLEAKHKKNLTSNLFNILANYNIRTDDKLPNYALSLRQNSRNSNNEFVYMHVPIKIPFKYNSPNHLPIDPLLAVFLSNYGHYLPRQYGFQRSYENLYGYLASNNIHNNNPYGSYKIFSDTDSSH